MRGGRVAANRVAVARRRLRVLRLVIGVMVGRVVGAVRMARHAVVIGLRILWSETRGTEDKKNVRLMRSGGVLVPYGWSAVGN